MLAVKATPDGGKRMRTSIIGVVLTASLLSATTRASQYQEPRSKDEPAAKVSALDKDNKSQEQGSTPQDASTSRPAQAQSKDEKRIREVKNRIRQMGVARRITVVLLNENERYGSIELIGDESFQLAEVDTNQEVKVFYKDVRKVRTGYGQFNAITGKRIDPKWNLIAKIAVAALLFIVIPLSVPRT